MIPHNMALLKFICVQYQFHGQTLPIMKIDRGKIRFREYVQQERNLVTQIDRRTSISVLSRSVIENFGDVCLLSLDFLIF